MHQQETQRAQGQAENCDVIHLFKLVQIDWLEHLPDDFCRNKI